MEARKTPVKRILQKKRPGLFSDDLLNELGKEPAPSVPLQAPTLPLQNSNIYGRRISSIRDKKEKKRERWLLTRKTWKYMSDAGRKLIPDGAQNRPEDIQKCERHFNNVCANEPRFILCRRKASYPGAIGASRNSKRRLKLLLSHSHKGINSFDYDMEESQNADQVIDLLSNYLRLDESIKITTLLGSKTVRPDQTSSPSAQRPGGCNASSGGFGSKSMAMSSRGAGFLPPLAQPSKGVNKLSEIDQLLDRLRTLSRSSTCRTIISIENITPDILEDKVLLKQIYNELKKQQLHRIIGKHSSGSVPRASLSHASSLSSLWQFRRDGSTKSSFLSKPNFFPHFGLKSLPSNQHPSSPPLSPAQESTKRVPPSSLDFPAPFTSTLKFQTTTPPVISPVKKISRVNETYVSSGTQTNFIQLDEIERLAKDYKEMKQEELEAFAASQNVHPTDDESDKSATAGQGHRRKSSIDNEDVSQSVSDTIKRYLRMARKKSVHEDNANRFKRVNYDRNLRNIRAKGEINPPGIDEGLNKATQTLDAWSVILINFIRGHDNTVALQEAHLDWCKSLDNRMQQKQDYINKIKLKEQHNNEAAASKAKKHSTHLSASVSAPTSPTNALHGHNSGSFGAGSTASGIIQSSTQFLSNLWHGTAGHYQDKSSDQDYNYHTLPGSNTNSTGSIISVGTTASGHSYNSKSDNSAMQKSKSSSNVGQFVSKKIFKTRSKSQTRPSTSTKAEWTPKGNCTWTSNNGRQVTLTNSHLQNLTEVEAQLLQRVALEKINQLNIGVSVVIPSYSDSTGKAPKRRPLTKKKAMTTSFFDIGKKDDKGQNVSIFGNTLEDCVAHDQKRRANMTTTSDRGSRNSITSLFRGSSSSKVRSCESLPSSTGSYNLPHSNSNSSSMLISSSQWDLRRSSQDLEEFLPQSTSVIDAGAERQVPTFVQECIKHLEKYGLHSVGIFRVSTSKKRVREMREEFNRSSSTFINPETCPHDVATLLKEFLRDLPEPLLCRNLYKAFIKTQKIRNRRLQLEALSHLVQLLPTAHRDTLFVLLRFLAKVASCCDDTVSSDGSVNVAGNKMDSNNLATVFAPNILRSSLPGEENHEQESMGDVINVIRTMIDHYEELFRVQAELMDEIYTNMIDTFPEQLNVLCERRNAAESFTFDEIDNTGSNTLHQSPLTTTSVVKNSSDVNIKREQLQHKYQFNNELPPDGRSHCESSSSSPRVPPLPTSRRIYTREDVMHGNAVSKGDPPQDGPRRLSSKSKYFESDSSSQQRSSIKNKSSNLSDTSNTPSTTTSTTTKIETHSKQQQPNLSAALSPATPYSEDQVRVVTASLKIPVQMQATATATTTTPTAPSTKDFRTSSSSSNNFISGARGGTVVLGAISRDKNDDDEVFYGGPEQFDLSNIPYIEDSTVYANELGNCIEGFPITGSLSFGGGVSATTASGDSLNVMNKTSVVPPIAGKCNISATQFFQIPLSYKNQQISPAEEGGEYTTSLASSFPTLKTLPPSLPATTPTPHLPSSTSKSTSSPNTSVGQKKSSKRSQMEQRLPTSISNIGGATLRSKTAEFERMSSGPSTTSQPFHTIATDPRRRNIPPVHPELSPSQRQLYKRQELISSAKGK